MSEALEKAVTPYCGAFKICFARLVQSSTTVYAIAAQKREDGIEFFHYSKFLMLENFKLENFLKVIVRGYVFVDFDARTGHNHDTKFRLRQDKYPYLYDSIQELHIGAQGN